MKTITTLLLAFTLIGCDKEEKPQETKTPTQTQQGTVEESFTFVCHISMSIFDLYDGATLLSSGNNSKSPCNDVEYTLTSGQDYRIVCRLKGVNNDYTQIACEYTLRLENGVLTTVKSNGNYNMFWADDCGYFTYTVK